MALPRIEAVITADTKQAEAGFARVERGMEGVGNAADRAGARTTAMGAAVNAAAGRSSGFARGIQNASFQLGDFATQVGAGTSASIALGQQLPQLLGGFGILGAVLGAVVAIAVPLTRAFQGMSENGADLSQVLGVLAPLADELADAFRTVAQVGVTIAEVIINNLDRILITAGLVAGFFAAKWVAAFVAARIATMSLSGALLFLRGALIRTGIGALIVGAGELVYQFTRLVQAAGGMGEALGAVGAVFEEVWGRMSKGISLMGDAFNGVGKVIEGAFSAAFGYVGDQFNNRVIIPITEGLNTLIRAANALGANFSELNVPAFSLGTLGGGMMDEGLADISGAVSGMGDLFSQPLQSVQKIRDLLASVKDDRITIPDLLGVGAGEDGEEGGAGKKLDEELTAQEDRIREHFARIKALTQGSLSDRLGSWDSYFSSLAALTGSNNKKLLGLAKSFAAAQALIDAWRAHNAVLADPTLPWWARIASAAQVFAAGLGAVNAIKSISDSGGSSGGSRSASGGGASSAPSGPMQTTYINLQGDNFSRGTVEGLLEQIQSRMDRGGRLVFQ